jgi:hypothetical protein
LGAGKITEKDVDDIRDSRIVQRMTSNKQIKNGTPVKITYGMGRTVLGQISDTVVNKWGTSYEITTEDGEVEYADTFVTGSEMGVSIL